MIFMELKVQKRLAGEVLGCSQKRVAFDPAKLEDIKEAITKRDIKSLVSEGIITEKQKAGVSRVRARKTLVQKRKGLQKGPGSKKGKRNARDPEKTRWIRKIRAQREFLHELKEKKLIEAKTFTSLYRKAKGGFFRSKRHIKIFVEENGLFRK